MGKTYKVILNSVNQLPNSSTQNSNYYIDWSAILPNNKSFKVKFSYFGSNNHINGFVFPVIVTNLLTNNFDAIGSSYSNSYTLGILNFNMTVHNSNYGNFCASVDDNPESFIQTRPFNNNLNIQIIDNLTKYPYLDSYFTVAGTGQLTQTNNIITVTTSTTGQINIGTLITVSGIVRKVIAFGTGTGGAGTYLVDNIANIAVATAYTFPADFDGNPPGDYVLQLLFEEV